MQFSISVIIPSHNPRPDHLSRVLQALQGQTLITNRWELILIDNASDERLDLKIDLKWHPYARIVREDQLGSLHARLRGFKEATANTLVLVDDDNVLDPDYLEHVLHISENFPSLGSWGGQIRPEFEVPPAEWTKPYWGYLAIREFNCDKWSNLLYQHETTPCGAGQCVRRVVTDKYIELLKLDSRRSQMGRFGRDQLGGSEDTDLAFTAYDLGLGTGQFSRLKLTHLLPENRLEEAYLLRLLEANIYSYTILCALRGKFPDLPSSSWRARLHNKYKMWRMNPNHRRFHIAATRGHERAIQAIYEKRNMDSIHNSSLSLPP